MIYSNAFALCMFLLYMIGESEVNGRFLLVPEDAELCRNRPKHWRWYNDTSADEYGYYETVNPHYYFYSNDVREYKGQKYDWLAARNLCRQFCMDAVSIESYNENQMIYSFMDSRGLLKGRKERLKAQYGITRHSSDGSCGPNQPGSDTGYSYWVQCNPDSPNHCCNKRGECRNNEYYDNCGCLDCIDFKEKIEFVWTSGRICDFSGCETRNDLKPLLVKGWFWSGSNQAIPYTNEINAPEWSYIPWSKTGHFSTPQPDNAEEEVNGVPESCLAVAQDLYADGIQWHDISCYHPKPVICEDSDELLKLLNVQ